MSNGVVHLVTDHRRKGICGQPGATTKTRSAVTCAACLVLPVPGKPGRRSRGADAAARRVAIRLTDDEHERWTTAAGSRSLSDWIRETCDRAARERKIY